MVMIYRDIYHIFINFQFSCPTLDGHFKGQNSTTHFFGCVCIEHRVILQFSESLNPKEPGIKKSDILINNAILLICVKVRVVSLYKKIQPGLSGLLYQP